MGIAGLLVGLLVAEAVFHLRDDGAFPHVNFYQDDAELGVRLRPGASMRFGFQDNPVTDIHVNAQGYRGNDFSEVANGILVVGDSQVFGLGVNDDETMAAQLAELSGRTVLNGGVPTYGPAEYSAVAAELSEAYGITTLVYVVNMSNDFFEDTRPNLERHRVWDGWAVRSELAPESYTQFPGRELLFRQSHAFYALRRLLNQDAPRPSLLPSEGTWQDLVADSEALTRDHEAAEEDAERQSEEARLERQRIARTVADAANAVDERLRRAELEARATDGFYSELELARGHPGDIVGELGAEESRELGATAALIRRAVRRRQALIDARREQDPELAQALETQRQLRATQNRLRAESAGPVEARVPSTLEPRLQALRALADDRGMDVLVVALPLDVLVSSDEWAKYGESPVDMEPTRALLRDLVASAEHLGMRGLDATDALRAAEPGAFLRGDLHMTAKGQRALAEAVHAALESPPPLRSPEPGMPEGRSVLPTYAEWLHTPEATVRGSSAAYCETVRIREWLRVTCRRRGRSRPTAVAPAAPGESLVLVTAEAADYIVPLKAGVDVRTEFHWTDRSQTLNITWNEGAPTMAFSERRAAEVATRVDDERADRLCACHREVIRERACRNHNERYGEWTECGEPICEHAFGAASDGCFNAYADDCAALLRCTRGEGSSPPVCSEGEAIAGGIRQCFALCDEAHPCAEGTCVPWQGSGICL
ncbi:MAG: hypothetical protein AAF938_11495 [Myxococcota bacterium]